MRVVFNIVYILILLTKVVSAQSVDNLKKEKERSEKEIAYLNKLLDEAKNTKTASLNKLNLVQKKMEESRKLLSTLNQEVRYFEQLIVGNEKKRTELSDKKEEMLNMYSKLIYGLWKKRGNTNKLMFIFAAADFNQAYNRYKYFEQIQTYSKRQIVVIEQINDSLYSKNQEFKKYVEQKNKVLEEINHQNKELIKQKDNENELIRDLQKKEKEIIQKIKNEQANRNKLEQELKKLITAQNKKSTNASTDFQLTPEEKIISENFVNNKGKLPWPVTQGIISEKYGIKVHPLYKGVEIKNNGVSITTSRNSEIRVVFKGVVTQIWFQPGLNNIVFIRHGNYYTAYANLADVNVKVGQQVDIKEIIGKVSYDDTKGSVLNFEIWFTTGKGEPTTQNPELWLSK